MPTINLKMPQMTIKGARGCKNNREESKRKSPKFRDNKGKSQIKTKLFEEKEVSDHLFDLEGDYSDDHHNLDSESAKGKFSCQDEENSLDLDN